MTNVLPALVVDGYFRNSSLLAGAVAYRAVQRSVGAPDSLLRLMTREGEWAAPSASSARHSPDGIASDTLREMGERERKHFEAIGRAMRDDEAPRIDEAMALSQIERINLGLRLGAAMPTNDAIEAELDRRALEQVEIHLRLRRLARAKERRGP